MANADGYVLPKPGIPKTLGILNVIFGVLTILWGICALGGLLLAPALMEFGQKTVKDAQAKVIEQQKAQLKVYDDREAAAKTDDEKKAIQQERQATIASTPAMPPMDMSAATAMMKDPVVVGFTFANGGTGLILSVLLLISGIGLIRLVSWGRSLGVAYAGLQIAQVVLMTAVSLLFVQPTQQANLEKMLVKQEADAKLPNAPPGAAEAVKMSRAMSNPGMAQVMSLAWPVLGSIYPVILLVLLNKPGARAALQGPKTRGPGDF